MKKRISVYLLLALLVLSFSALSNAKEIVIWDYVPWRIEYYQQYADQYMAENPGVKIELGLFTLSEYVDKIKVGLATGTAPTMFSFHPSFIADFAGLLEPFPQDLFPIDRLSQELLGYSQLVQDGKVYYYPLGLQGPMLFINQDHWDNAGIADFPRTWQEAADIGRRTTRAVNGVTEVAGFFFSDGDMMADMFVDLNYQFGGKVYRNNGAQVAFDEAPAQDAVNLIADMYRTGMSGFGESMTFQAGQHVMRYSMAWRQQQIAGVANFPWTVAPLPTLTGELHPGMSKMDYYLGKAVPIGHSPEMVAEAFKFIHWAYEDDARLMDLNSRSGTLPSRMSLWGSPEIVENPVLYTLTQTLPYAAFPGEYPQWIKNELQQVAGAIRSGSSDPAVLLRDVTRIINARMQVEPITWVAE